MSQSICARCQDTIPRSSRQPAKLLCDPCESAWRVEFNRNLRRHLARLNDGLDARHGAKRPLPVAAE
jgi:hypothetical protein